MRIAIVGVVPLAPPAEIIVSVGMNKHCANPKLTGIVVAGAEGAAGIALLEASLSLKHIDRVVLLHAKPTDLSRVAFEAIKSGASALSIVDASVPLWKHALDYPGVKGLLLFADGGSDVEAAATEASRRKLPIRRVAVHRTGSGH